MSPSFERVHGWNVHEPFHLANVHVMAWSQYKTVVYRKHNMSGAVVLREQLADILNRYLAELPLQIPPPKPSGRSFWFKRQQPEKPRQTPQHPSVSQMKTLLQDLTPEGPSGDAELDLFSSPKRSYAESPESSVRHMFVMVVPRLGSKLTSPVPPPGAPHDATAEYGRYLQDYSSLERFNTVLTAHFKTLATKGALLVDYHFVGHGSVYTHLKMLTTTGEYVRVDQPKAYDIMMRLIVSPGEDMRDKLAIYSLLPQGIWKYSPPPLEFPVFKAVAFIPAKDSVLVEYRGVHNSDPYTIFALLDDVGQYEQRHRIDAGVRDVLLLTHKPYEKGETRDQRMIACLGKLSSKRFLCTIRRSLKLRDRDERLREATVIDARNIKMYLDPARFLQSLTETRGTPSHGIVRGT